MSRILRRPMFRGGPVSSYGNGIASGLADGGRVGYKNAGFITGGELLSLASTFPELNMYKDQKFNPKTKYKIGGDNSRQEIIDRIASFSGTPGLQDLAFADSGIYNLSASLDANKNKDKNKLVTSDENITVDDDMSFDIDKERSNRIALEESERMQKNQLSELLQDMSKNEQYEKDILTQRKETVDQPIVGVTEKESFEDDGTEMGFQSIADKADSFYEALTGGAEERAAKRLALEEAKAKEKISRARKTDAFNTMLKFFEGSQQEGATVGSAAAEASKYLTSKPSATELAMDKRDTREEALADRAFVLDEKRRDTAGQMAFKEYMQQEAFDFSDVKSKKDFDRKMSMLEKKLKSAETVAEKNIIAQAMRDAKKQWAPGITKKKLDTLTSLDPNSKEYKLALADFNLAPSFDAQVKKDMLSGGGLTIETADTYAQIYYPDYKGFLVEGAVDGMFLNPTDNTLYRVDSNGEATPFKKLNIS